MKNLGTLNELDKINIPKFDKKEVIRREMEDAAAEAQQRANVKRAMKDYVATKPTQNTFPIEVFPASIQEFIKSHHSCYGFPLDWYAGAIMSVGGTLIGNGYAAEYEIFWYGVPYFWVFMVGNMSTGKSQVLKHTLFPIEDFQKQLFTDNQAKYQAWENEKANGNPHDQKEPEARRVLLNKFSMEKALQLMQDNPKGILMYRDELRGWVNSFNQYRKGDDEETILEIWDNGNKMIDMVKGSIYIQRTYMGVLGGIQPHVIQGLAANDRSVNGFVVRCLFSYPDDLSKPYPTKLTPDMGLRNKYLAFMEYLHRLPNAIIAPDPAIKYSPCRVDSVRIPFTEKAKDAFFEYLKSSTDKQNKCENDIDRGFLGKFDTYVVRFASLLKMFDLAEERYDIQASDLIESEGRTILKDVTIDDTVLARALMMMEYFKITSSKVTQRIESPVNELPPNQIAWYRAWEIDKPIKTKTLIESAKENGISQRTAEKLISDQNLFKKLSTGWYERKQF